MNTYEIFTEMRKLPKGYIIEDPYGLIQTDFKITAKILHILKTKDNSVFFTRLSIKHLSEKVVDGEYIFSKIKQILKEPDRIHIGNFSNRFLISKDILFNNSLKAHIVNLEINKKNRQHYRYRIY